MIKILVIFVLLFSFVESRLQTQFVVQNEPNSFVESRLQTQFVVQNEPNTRTRIVFNLTVGSQEQNLQFELESGNSNSYTNGLYVLDKMVYGHGFNSGESTSFVKTGKVSNMFTEAMNGTETIKIGTTILKKKPIQVVSNDSHYQIVYDGKLGIDKLDNFSYNACKEFDGCTSFIESALRRFDEKILALVFDNFTNFENPYTGQLFLGEKAPDFCGVKWAYLPERPRHNFHESQWNFHVSRIDFDIYSYLDPPGYGKFDFTSSKIYLPTMIYKKLMTMLKAEEDDNMVIPCNTTYNITITLGGDINTGVELNITPEAYVLKVSEDQCIFNGGDSHSNTFQLPVTFLSNHCLMFDYKTSALFVTNRLPIKHT